MGQSVGVGAGLDDGASEGEPVDDRGAEPRVRGVGSLVRSSLNVLEPLGDLFIGADHSSGGAGSRDRLPSRPRLSRTVRPSLDTVNGKPGIHTTTPPGTGVGWCVTRWPRGGLCRWGPVMLVCVRARRWGARRPSEGFWSWRRHRSSTSELTWTGGWRMSVCRCSCHTAGWRGVRRCRRPARVLKIRVTFSILMSPRCHQVAEILKSMSPLLCPQLQNGMQRSPSDRAAWSTESREVLREDCSLPEGSCSGAVKPRKIVGTVHAMSKSMSPSRRPQARWPTAGPHNAARQ